MRKYYDEEDELDEETAVQRPELRHFLSEEHLKKRDMLIAVVLGAFVFVLLSIFPFPGLCPDAWDDAAIASALRPPENIFPGFGRVIARLFYSGGISLGNTALIWAGRIVCGITAAAAFMFLRSSLALLVRGTLRYSSKRYLVQRIAAGLGAIFFACGDSVWRNGQTFMPDSLLVMMALMQMTFFINFLMNGRMASALASMAIGGLLAADTPFGFFTLIGCWGVFMLAYRHFALCKKMPILDPVVGSACKWMLTAAWSFGLILGIGVNVASFVLMHGLEAAEMATSDLPLAYLLTWWNIFTSAANGLGWTLGITVCILPFIVSSVMLPRAVDEEHFLPYHVGAVFFFSGALAYTQVCMLPPLWFHTWSDTITVSSPFLNQMFVLGAAGAVTLLVTTLGGDVCCRNYVRLAMMRFGELREDEESSTVDLAKDHQNYGKRYGLIIFLVAAALLIAGVLPGRSLTRTREMLKLIDDYANEIVNECGNIHWIFTDGSYDSRIELGVAERGGKINALAMMRGNTSYQQYLRRRGVKDTEDLMSLSMGAPMTLRSWMRDKPERLADAATQLGFELWKRDGKELPVCSGVLARPEGMSEEECKAGIERTNLIANRILNVYASGGLHKAAGKKIRELFLYAQWRIARLARMRAERADRMGNVEAALVDNKLSDNLDDTNESLTEIKAKLEKLKATTLRQVTARESLQLALARADFALARRYGEIILKVDPEDASANFGVGMSYALQKQYARAEEFLRKAAEKRPNEPAMWNNLAMITMCQKRFDEADEFAKKALELIPESAEVKDTIKQIAEARAADAEKKEDKKGAFKTIKTEAKK